MEACSTFRMYDIHLSNAETLQVAIRHNPFSRGAFEHLQSPIATHEAQLAARSMLLHEVLDSPQDRHELAESPLVLAVVLDAAEFSRPELMLDDALEDAALVDRKEEMRGAREEELRVLLCPVELVNVPS